MAARRIRLSRHVHPHQISPTAATSASTNIRCRWPIVPFCFLALPLSLHQYVPSVRCPATEQALISAMGRRSDGLDDLPENLGGATLRIRPVMRSRYGFSCRQTPGRALGFHAGYRWQLISQTAVAE